MPYAIVVVIALILDQAVKYWTTANIVVDTGEHKLIPGFIHLSNVHNSGAAFSLLRGARWVFVLLCIIFVAVVIYLLVKNIINGRAARWMSIVVIAGAVGNCIDRVINGYVVDMFEFEFMTFPVFNIADICITVGGILFCLCILFEKDNNPGKVTLPAAIRSSSPAAGAVRTQSAPRETVNKPAAHRLRKADMPAVLRHPSVSETGVDPNDPFAEWARIASGDTPAAKPAPAESESPEIVVESPAPDQDSVAVKANEPAPVPEKSEKHAAAEKTPDAPAKPETDDSFDLDDILNEFRDK